MEIRWILCWNSKINLQSTLFDLNLIKLLRDIDSGWGHNHSKHIREIIHITVNLTSWIMFKIKNLLKENPQVNRKKYLLQKITTNPKEKMSREVIFVMSKTNPGCKENQLWDSNTSTVRTICWASSALHVPNWSSRHWIFSTKTNEKKQLKRTIKISSDRSKVPSPWWRQSQAEGLPSSTRTRFLVL